MKRQTNHSALHLEFLGRATVHLTAVAGFTGGSVA